MGNALVRVFAVALSSTDEFRGYRTAYFFDLATARRIRREHRERGGTAVLSVEYLPAHIAAGLVNAPRGWA